MDQRDPNFHLLLEEKDKGGSPWALCRLVLVIWGCDLLELMVPASLPADSTAMRQRLLRYFALRCTAAPTAEVIDLKPDPLFRSRNLNALWGWRQL